MSDDGDRRATAVQTVAAVFLPIASIAVILRCYVRGMLIKSFGWDDGAMVIAMAFYIMFCACMIGGTRYGTGHRFADLTAHQRVTAMKYWWLCEIAYCFASIGCKISVCIFLLRITVKRIHVWILYTIMAFTVITGLVFMFIMLLQCKPLEYFWTRTALDPSIPGHCINIEIVINMTYVYSGFAALCDFTVGLLPIFLVANLQMRKQTKLAVVGILSMACIASSAVIVRIPFVRTFAEPDFLYATIQIAIWSNVEAGLGITAGSLATLRPLLRHWLGTSTTDYTRGGPSPFPGRKSGSRLPHDRAFPLGSLDDSVQSRLRPDKLALTVTTVQTQSPEERERERDVYDEHWPAALSSSNSSEERLTAQQMQVGSPVGAVPRVSGDRMGIHQMIEVTQTSTNVRTASVREHV
ncbi:putative integral membrane protein [Aspergillus unguis]